MLSITFLNFIYSILPLQNWCLGLFYNVCLCYVLFSLFCQIVFLFSSRSLNFLKITILKFLIKQITALHFFGISMPLVVSCFFDFFMFLEVLQYCLYIWKSRHLLQSLLTGLGKAILSNDPVRDSEGFSDFFCEYVAPDFLFPLGGKLLNLYACSWSCRARPCADSFSFPCFSYSSAQFCVLSPNPTGSG